MKKLSCGIVLKTEKGYLLCHPTGRKGVYDIPKGCIEEGETEWECAKRELKEETGIVLDEKNTTYIENLGRFHYLKDKDLHLFYCEAKGLDLNNLVCTSLIEANGLPEVDHYIFANDFTYCFPSLQNVLNKIDF